MVVIVVSGMPGCGSSTSAKLLAKKLNLDFFSVGDFNKGHMKNKMETDRSISMWKTEKGASVKFHNQSDDMARKAAVKGCVVVEGKLAVRMVKQRDLSVWLKAGKNVRAERYAERDGTSFEEAIKRLNEKERLEKENFKKIYGFDYFDQEREADIIINTSDKTPEQITDMIISRIKRVFIVHRWEGKPAGDWYPSVKNEMEKKGWYVNALAMPDSAHPNEKKWVAALRSAVGEPNENTFLVGHSAGVMTILRYLESLDDGKRVGGCVLVAGWTDDLGYKQLSNFFKKPISWERVKAKCGNFVAIHSDNDPFVDMRHGHAFKAHLGAKLVVEHAKKHMTGGDGVKALPSVVEAIEKIYRRQ